MKKMTQPIWDCRQARAEIALEAGGDADDAVAARLLEAHLTDCEICREYRLRMRTSLEALQSSATPAYAAVHQRSLWPGIAARLPAVIRPSAAARFNVWVPTAAMAVACSAMLLVTIVQLERVIPFEPTLTPQVRMVLGREEPRDLFPRVSAERLRMVKGRPGTPGMVPVKLDYVPRFEPKPREPDFE